jgi:hypothetical protein
MTEFFQTRMGQRFYEHTVPSLVSAIERLAAAVERMNDIQQQKEDHDSQSRTQEDPKPPQR